MELSTQLIIVLFALIFILFWLWRRTSRQLAEVRFQRYSLSSKYGKMTEQFLPFLASYPYNPQNFRFIGTPIDGVQFEDDRIVFLEFKAADGTLTQRQRAIRKLIEEKRILFQEVRLR